MLQKVMQACMSPERMIEMFTYKVMSNQSIGEVSQKVKSECDKHNFSLLYSYNYHEILESKGFPISRKVYVYEICQAKTASTMLTDFPHFSIFMPCRLAIYESNKQIVISTMNMEVMLKAVRSNQELYKEATSLYNTLISLIKALANA